MKITVDLDELKELGSYKLAFTLGYCRAKPNFTIKELCEDLCLCDTAAKRMWKEEDCDWSEGI